MYHNFINITPTVLFKLQCLIVQQMAPLVTVSAHWSLFEFSGKTASLGTSLPDPCVYIKSVEHISFLEPIQVLWYIYIYVCVAAFVGQYSYCESKPVFCCMLHFAYVIQALRVLRKSPQSTVLLSFRDSFSFLFVLITHFRIYLVFVIVKEIITGGNNVIQVC